MSRSDAEPLSVPHAAPSILTLLRTTALASLALTALTLLAPHLRFAAPVARELAITLAITTLLCTGLAAPSRGERRPAWFVGLSVIYAMLFALDLGEPTPALVCLLTLLLLTTAGIVGGYIGSLLEYPGMLMVVSYVATLTDCASVFHPDGLTARVLKHPKALALLTLTVPMLGSDELRSLVGIGDVAFVCLYVAGARTTGLPVRRTLSALGLALAAVALCTELLGMALPALPFLGAAVLVAHPEARKIPPHQTVRIGLNLALVTLVMGALLWSALAGSVAGDGASAQPL